MEKPIFSPDRWESLYYPPTSLPIPKWGHTVCVDTDKTSISKMEDEYQGVTCRGRDEPLNFAKEANRYFGKLRDDRPEYYDLVSGYEKYLRQRWPVANILTTVAIAAASHEENNNLHRTLEVIASNNPEYDYEVVVFLNRPISTGYPEERIYENIRQFMVNHPDFPLRIFSHTYEKENGIGLIKRTLHDVVALRHMIHCDEGDEPTMVMCDADTVNMSADYIEKMTLPIRSSAIIDAVAGHLDWDHDVLDRYPELHFATRLYQVIDRILHYRGGERKVTSGATTALRLSAYCATDGTKESDRGEDVLHGISIARMRGGGTL